ncbi:Diguanylate cyclase with PAS/PAC sensor [Candidatus Terasakiella magnetica]|uniref:diguanylate cyclase n=1 Tax=Candidatus Terasakiella magnetica TaxID=1867952 RepID=A0A1C3RHR4_9PROT|nr:sensor domain-containing diguanylate cyclase [Candidatus Terasakiella magnetica]SCA56816.1 Diguanylate cyclase with PAS/PAC sensor [Candidatus Terasakiella magnetica]
MVENVVFFDDNEGTTDAVLTHQTLIDTQEKLGALLDLMPTGLIIHQMQGVLFANQQALHLFEKDHLAMVGKHILDYAPDDAREKWSEMFMSTFMRDEPVRFPELTLKRSDGSLSHIQVSAGRLPWEGTSVIQIMLEDVTELKQQAKELEKLTFNDVLTGAFNRRYFIQHASESVAYALDEAKPFSLLIFDVDWFKKVNDTYGHQAGDEALKTISAVWQRNTRQNEFDNRKNDSTLARIGGEEFAIYLPNVDQDGATAIAERIRSAIAENTVIFKDLRFKITASFGATSLKHGDESLDDLIRRADLALYKAKENGRNRVEFE